MSELTDLEICKCIAEIECVKFTVVGGEIAADTFQVHELFSCAHMGFIFNPLADDALCFKLMIKYSVKPGFTECPAGTGKAYYADFSDGACVTEYCSTPNKAIFLAIIELHK